jgi:hypothetical protein
MFEKKKYNPTKILTLDQALTLRHCFKPTPLESDVRVNKVGGGMHHDMSFIDASGKQYTSNVELPIRPSTAIIVKPDEKTGKWAMFMLVDIFENWPERDAEGEKLMQFLELNCTNYCEDMERPEMLEIKKKLLKGTKQYDFKDNKELRNDTHAMKTITMASRVKSPVLWPEIKEGEPNAGEIDKTKSPFFKLKIWEEEEKKEKPFGPNDLVVNGGRQKIHGSVYNRTENMKAPQCKTEADISPLFYFKGSAKNGAEMFRLDVLIKLMPATIYFPAEKKADVQFKHHMIVACGKHIVTGNFGLSAEEERGLMNKVMTYHARRGLDQLPSSTDSGDSHKRAKTEEGQTAYSGDKTDAGGAMLTPEEELARALYERDLAEAQSQLSSK